jgi:RsiW-degrading membrane proteinase PrsW (M82 family)
MEQKYSTGMRWLLYILSLIPLVGLIAGIVLMTKEDAESKQVGKNCIIAMIIGVVLIFACVCCFNFSVFGLIAGTGG